MSKVDLLKKNQCSYYRKQFCCARIYHWRISLLSVGTKIKTGRNFAVLEVFVTQKKKTVFAASCIFVTTCTTLQK